MSIVIAGMAASLDGYIQSNTKDLSWLNDAMSPDEDYGFEDTLKRIGAYIMGATTYREILAMGMAGGFSETPTYIVTHDSTLETERGTQVYAGDLRVLIDRLKLDSPADKAICVYGGGDIVTQCLDQNLIDELSISLIPILLGEGIPFFGKLSAWKRLTLVECKPLSSGIVMLKYTLQQPSA